MDPTSAIPSCLHLCWRAHPPSHLDLRDPVSPLAPITSRLPPCSALPVAGGKLGHSSHCCQSSSFPSCGHTPSSSSYFKTAGFASFLRPLPPPSENCPHASHELFLAHNIHLVTPRGPFLSFRSVRTHLHGLPHGQGPLHAPREELTS